MTSSVGAAENPDLDNLLNNEAINDPASYYAKLRDIDPVYWNNQWNGWVLTSYEAVSTANRYDGQMLSSDRFAGPFGRELRRSTSEHEQLIAFLSKFFIFRDPPHHTRMKTLVIKSLTPKSVEILRPRVRSTIVDIVDSLRETRGIDFLSEFAFSLPLIVIAEFIGFPVESRHDLRVWTSELMGVLANRVSDKDRVRRGEEAMKNLVEFLRPVVRARRENPRDDLLTRMAQAEDQGTFLSEDEVVANAVLMVVGGHETTASLLANGVVAFSKFPDQWDRLRKDLSLVPSAVEEILRYDSPSRAEVRWVKEPFELCGHTIDTGDRMLLVQYAANHDPTVFENPDKFDIGRRPNRHISFGFGRHACVGAALSRLEAQEFFAHLAAEYSAIDVLNTTLTYDQTIISRSLKELTVNLRGK